MWTFKDVHVRGEQEWRSIEPGRGSGYCRKELSLPHEKHQTPAAQSPAPLRQTNLEWSILAGWTACWYWILISVSARAWDTEREGRDAIRDVILLGRNGAALAAFGEIVVVFFAADEPLADRCDGVKLGDSTFNRFLLPPLLLVCPCKPPDHLHFPADFFDYRRDSRLGIQPVRLVCRVDFLRVMVKGAALKTDPTVRLCWKLDGIYAGEGQSQHLYLHIDIGHRW